MSLYIGNQKIPTLNVRLSSSGIVNYQTKTVTPTTSIQTVVADTGYDALRQVTVNAIPSNYIVPSGNKAITANGTNIDVKNYATVSVNVPTGSTISNQNKTVTPTESSQSISADSGYTGLGTVTVNAISSTYVGTGIARKSSSDLTVSGATVSVPAGYYSSAASKAVSSMTLPTSVSTSSSGTAKLTVTPTTAARYLNIPTGYNGTASYYTISGDSNLVASNIRSGVTIFGVTGSYTGSGGGTTINNQNKTVTPTTSQQSITADSGYTGLGTVTVNAMPAMTLPTAATASATSGFSSKATIGRSTADQYINIPTGYNSTGAYYKISAVANGSVNNPTASKGTVSNNSISITPSVTSTTGYITGSTKTGTAVTVTASELVSGNKSITANGTNIDVTNYATVSVAVPVTTVNNQNKTVSPSTSQQSVTADSGYTGLGTVTINAMPTMTLPTSASSSSSGTNKATISRSTSAQYINIPTGYNSSAAYYTISAVANGSVTAPSSISGTTATVSTGTNTLTLTKTVSVTPNVTTAGYISSGTAGNASVSLTASVTTKAAATYRASTSAQTIAAGTYLTGAQTIAAVSQTNLSAANIKAGTTISISNGQSNIWSVAGTFTSDATAAAADIASGKTAYVNGSKLTGSLTFIDIYTGSSAPSSSLGSNGDIYIQS